MDKRTYDDLMSYLALRETTMPSFAEILGSTEHDVLHRIVRNKLPPDSLFQVTVATKNNTLFKPDTLDQVSFLSIIKIQRIVRAKYARLCLHRMKEIKEASSQDK